MKEETQAALLRRNLDEILTKWRRVPTTVPRRGWVHDIREALGMTGGDFGQRLGISPSAVTGIEQSEAKGTVRLVTLRRAARALNCTLVYALVPNRPLEKMVEGRRRRIAALELSTVLSSVQSRDEYRDLIAAYGQTIKRNRLWREELGRIAPIAKDSVRQAEVAPAPPRTEQKGAEVDLANASIEELIGILLAK